MSKDFVVNIERLTAGVSQGGFGLILLAVTGATALQAGLGYKKYADLTAVEIDYASGAAFNLAKVLFAQTPSPREIAIVATEGESANDLTTLLDTVKSEDFFGLVISDNALRTAATTFADANKKLFAVTTESTDTTAESDNTILGYHDDIDDKNYVAEALLVHLLLRPIGSTTGKARVLQGISASEVSEANLSTLATNNALTYIEKYGVAQTTEGKVSTGEYIDVILGSYFIEFGVEQGLASLLVNSSKIPYSNAGIAQLASVVTKVLRQAVAQDIILQDEDGQGIYTVTYVPREDVSSADLADRVYNGLSFEATLAGAIHEATLQGTLVL